MAAPLPCPRCGTQLVPGEAPVGRADCLRCRAARAAAWAAGGLGLLLVAGGVLALAVGSGSLGQPGCTCQEGQPSQLPCAPAPRPHRRPPQPNAATPGETGQDTTPPHVKPLPAEATRAPSMVVPLGGGRLLHPGVPGLLLHVAGPALL